MLLSRESCDANVVRAWEEGAVRVGEHWLRGHLILSPTHIVEDWAVRAPLELTLADLQPAVTLQPDILLLGTGIELVLPQDLTLTGELAGLGIGLEIMSTPAACRTFNVLVHEQRRVVAALFNSAPASTQRR